MNTDTLIRRVGDDLFIGSSRVLLENIVIAHRRGETPEHIQENFPSLSLAQVYGALVHYLEHQAGIDAKFEQHQRTLDALDEENRLANEEFFEARRVRFLAHRSVDSEVISEASAE